MGDFFSSSEFSGFRDSDDCVSDNVANGAVLRMSHPTWHQHFTPLPLGTADKNVRFLPDTLPHVTSNPLGKLSVLPPELLHMVVHYLDLKSVLSFSQMNNGVHAVVRSTMEYALILQQAPDILLTARATNLTNEAVSVGTVYEELHNPYCRTCGDVGGFIYLLTCERVCELCFMSQNRFGPVIDRQLQELFPSTFENLENEVPSLRSLPGLYVNDTTLVTASFLLFDLNAVRSLVETRYPALLTHKLLDLWGKDEQMEYENPVRYMTVCQAPVLNRATHKPEILFHCPDCSEWMEIKTAVVGEWHPGQVSLRERSDQRDKFRLYNLETYRKHLFNAGITKGCWWMHLKEPETSHHDGQKDRTPDVISLLVRLDVDLIDGALEDIPPLVRTQMLKL